MKQICWQISSSGAISYFSQPIYDKRRYHKLKKCFSRTYNSQVMNKCKTKSSQDFAPVHVRI